MKNKVLKISILTMILVILMQVDSFAALETVTLNTKTDKDEYIIGDKVTVTVDWEKDAQAAGFTLKYDKDKLSFDSTTLGDNFYNADTAGEILFNWASFDGSNMKNVSFVLTAKVEGSTEISVQEAKGFADETMTPATDYEYKNKTITISKEEVKPVTLSSVAITKAPTKDTYSVGEKFDKAGMEITATYSDGSKKVVTDYTYSPADTLKITDTKVVISYTENGVTKTAEQKITVSEVKNNNSNTSTNTNTNTTQKPADTNTTKQPTNIDANNNNKPTTTTNKKDNTTASGKMPQTGAENVVLVIALVAVVGTIGFIKYKKLSDI